MKETTLTGESKDILNENIETLKELFPEIVSEDKIDFDKFKTIFGGEIDDSNERYSFTWPGKIQAIKEAQKQSTGTLRPCKEESKNWDTTKNLYIEGDNLEVLKLLQKSYYNKVKCIYIDPPYNTGKDFIYKDNYQDNLENYLKISGQKVEDYTREVLQTLVTAGARPDYVQVGNEVTYGMLWPTGHCWPSGADYDGGTWNNFARYLNAGSRAVREVCPRAKIIIHIELSRYTNAIAFFTQAVAHNVDFDIMGLSYYPSYHASTGTIFGALTTVLSSLQGSFPDAPVMIMEVAYGYAWNLPGTKYDFTSTYPYSEAGQAKFAKDLVTTLNARSNVKGIFWWWPEANEYGNNSYQVTTSWWNGSLIDNRNGRTQQAFYELLNFK